MWHWAVAGRRPCADLITHHRIEFQQSGALLIYLEGRTLDIQILIGFFADIVFLGGVVALDHCI